MGQTGLAEIPRKPVLPEIPAPKKSQRIEVVPEASLESFPLSISPRGSWLKSPVRGSADRYDEESIRLKAEKKLPLGSWVTVAFDAPRMITGIYAGMRCKFPAQVIGAREAWPSRPRYELILKWGKPLSEMVQSSGRSRSKRFGVLMFVVLAGVLYSREGTFRYFWYEPWLNLYAASIGAYFFSRFFLAFFHRPPAYTGYEPTISIVVSVRNEKRAIASCVRSCYAADYSPSKREVIVVDDGSNDGTAEVIDDLAIKIPELKAYHIRPSGKRSAMAKGIRDAKGDIVVVVDSDTILDRDALRQIVQGFEDPALGASAGYTAVGNADVNLLTRMQEVRYLVSYELMKAPESLFGAVSCCPGCLSAYRKEYLMKILDTWLNQTFMGARATFGDDRSLTNYILRDHRVIYNPLARSTTLVPQTWMRYLRQQCRWKKSWLREAPIAAKILARKHPIAALSFYASAVCSMASPIVAFHYLWGDRGDLLLGYLAGMMILGLLMSLFALWKRPTKYWYVTWFWIITQIVIMGPQTYYALLTMRKNHWGTR